MIGVLVLTHGNLAHELLVAARNIDERIQEAANELCLPWDIESDECSQQLKTQLRKLDSGDGVLILTDMFGGTASNLALAFLNPGHIEIVTGANLPMLIKLASLRTLDIEIGEIATRLATAGQKSIRLASEFLRQKPN